MFAVSSVHISLLLCILAAEEAFGHQGALAFNLVLSTPVSWVR